ncbi:hypothetical protein IFR04_008040 [Cadophora malorum]|uniref:Uncharacterized protein n=1 Tax=Cadophora malorum TaxID=108018 RepID=A0A8H7TGQ6_9HELO|nr:hypothetical protein IFR04_008040 [Cadophora malorum]
MTSIIKSSVKVIRRLGIHPDEYQNSQDLLNVAQNINKSKYSFRIGISILDLKRVTTESTDSTVNGFNFVGTKRNYFRKAERDFHFGETPPIDARIAIESLALLISSFRSDGQKLFQAYSDTYDIAGEVFECVG